MKQHDIFYGWNNEESTFYDDLKTKIKEAYGSSEIKAYIDGNLQPVDDIETYLINAWPPHVLDAIELFLAIDPLSENDELPKELNSIFRSEDCPCRLLEKQIVVLDSSYIESEILSKTYELLQKYEFQKACLDFAHAR
jgi:hypothetical protein